MIIWLRNKDYSIDKEFYPPSPSIKEYPIKNLATSLKTLPEVNPHHWFVLGREVQIKTMYLGSSTVTSPTKVPCVHPFPL